MILTKTSKDGHALVVSVTTTNRKHLKTGDQVNTDTHAFVNGTYRKRYGTDNDTNIVVDAWKAKGFTEDANLAVYECWKCTGKGHINGFQHVQGGVCFACAGAGLKIGKS